jgi:hypothetical protein
VDSTSLLRVNAPLFIGSARLASVFCNKSLMSEKAMAATSRRLFRSIDFNQAVDALPESSMMQNWNAMARIFWARDLSEAEAASLTAYRSQYLQSITGSDNKVFLTQELSLGVCTAMLSSFDSITL